MCVRSQEQRVIDELKAERVDVPCTCGHGADAHDPISGWCSAIIRWLNETQYETCMCEEYNPSKD
jgi:hypothetical protein